MDPDRSRKAAGVFLIILITSMLVYCGGGREPFDIDADEAREIIGGDIPPIVIDVRTPEEYVGELGHIAGSRLIPIDVFPDSIEALSNLKDTAIIVVCKVGYRSKKAVLRLLDNDFSKAYNLAGGMEAWNEAGGDIER